MRWLTPAFFLLLVSAAPPAEEKRFMVTGFDRVRVDGPFQVEIVAGSPAATASGDPRALDHVVVRVTGSTLVVNTGTIGWELRKAEFPGSARIRVSLPVLRGVTINGGAHVDVAGMRGDRIDLGLNGGGALTVRDLSAQELFVTLTGSGQMTLAGTAVRARVRSWGTGAVMADGLSAETAVLIGESSGPLRMQVRSAAQIISRGQGAVTVLGDAKCRVTGSGPVECANL